jgi:hypothetical protein
MGPKRWKSLGPRLTGQTGYGVMAWRLWKTLPTVHISHPLTSIFVDLLWSTWPSSKSQQMLMSSKLSTDTWHGYFLCWDKSHGAMDRKITRWRSGAFHLLPMCHISVKIKINVLVSECLLFYLFESPSCFKLSTAFFWIWTTDKWQVLMSTTVLQVLWMVNWTRSH